MQKNLYFMESLGPKLLSTYSRFPLLRGKLVIFLKLWLFHKIEILLYIDNNILNINGTTVSNRNQKSTEHCIFVEQWQQYSIDDFIFLFYLLLPK